MVAQALIKRIYLYKKKIIYEDEGTHTRGFLDIYDKQLDWNDFLSLVKNLQTVPTSLAGELLSQTQCNVN